MWFCPISAATRPKLVGADPDSDLAVLRIRSKKPLPQVELAKDDDLMIGEQVIAIGNPFGLSHTVTLGVISAVDPHRAHRPGQLDVQSDPDRRQHQPGQLRGALAQRRRRSGGDQHRNPQTGPGHRLCHSGCGGSNGSSTIWCGTGRWSRPGWAWSCRT